MNKNYEYMENLNNKPWFIIPLAQTYFEVFKY